MFDDDDDEARALDRLRSLGLLHLRGKPAELIRELDRLDAERKAFEAQGEIEKSEIRARRSLERAGQADSPADHIRAANGAGPNTIEHAGLKKTSTLFIATKSPGSCAGCRHANQGTADFTEGIAFCWMDHKPKQLAQTCDVTRILPRTRSSNEAWQEYWLYQAFDGFNGTYDRSTDSRLLAEDADDALREGMQAAVPIIE